MPDSLHLVLLKQELASRLADIAEVLPNEYRLTLIARHTRLADAEIVVTDDNMKLASGALAKRIEADA